MNNKVSSTQISMLLTLICLSMYIGLSDVILLRKANNGVLIGIIIGAIIGLIPILMYLKINNTHTNLNIFEKNKKLFKKPIANIFNALIFLFYLFLFIVSIRASVIFVTSKYLQNTPFYFVGILILITVFIIGLKGIEVISRISQISFIISLILVIIIEVLLFHYIEIDNILPIIINKKYVFKIIDAAIYEACSSALLSILLLTINKDKIIDKKRFNKTFLIFYLMSQIALLVVMFYVVSCFGFNMAAFLRRLSRRRTARHPVTRQPPQSVIIALQFRPLLPQQAQHPRNCLVVQGYVLHAAIPHPSPPVLGSAPNLLACGVNPAFSRRSALSRRSRPHPPARRECPSYAGPAYCSRTSPHPRPTR